MNVDFPGLSMSQQPDDFLTAPLERYSRSAPVPPAVRPLSDTQKAVLLHAQESMELSRQRSNKKTPMSRWIMGLAVAMLPVLAMVSGLDGFLRVLQHFNEMYATTPDQRPEPVAVPMQEPTQTEPGVVLLRPVEPLRETSVPVPEKASGKD